MIVFHRRHDIRDFPFINHVELFNSSLEVLPSIVGRGGGKGMLARHFGGQESQPCPDTDGKIN
jgi:hypothetical protein